MTVRGSRFIPWIVPGALWLWLCHHLHFEWTLNAQYNYGWAVPFLTAVLFYLRWPQRPEPEASRPRPLAIAAAFMVLLLLLPVRLLEEANPDWRLLSWALGLLVVVSSLITLLRFGGGAWLRHFAFPVAFILVAVPWPVQVENAIVHGLTRAVAYVAVEAASWLGIGAYQAGNVIQLANGFVGVDEACSGVKTLQAAIMVSLFLGELVGATALRRLALVLVGCAWMFACNIVRATALVVIAARSGIPALEHWHDLIGSAVLILGMAGLVAAAFLLQRKQRVVPPLPPRTETRPGSGFASIPLVETAAALLWITVIFAGAEAWYRAHESNLVARSAWEAQWPQGSTKAPIADTTAAVLRYDKATSAAWTEPPREKWWGFFARWEPRRTAVQLVRSHSPEICLPAIGRTFRGELAPEVVDAGPLALAFRVYDFEQHGQPLYVFVAVEEDKVSPGNNWPAVLDWSARGRIRAAWEGQRNMGQRLLELAVLGPPNGEAARSALQQTVRAIVRPASATD